MNLFSYIQLFSLLLQSIIETKWTTMIVTASTTHNVNAAFLCVQKVCCDKFSLPKSISAKRWTFIPSSPSIHVSSTKVYNQNDDKNNHQQQRRRIPPPMLEYDSEYYNDYLQIANDNDEYSSSSDTISSGDSPQNPKHEKINNDNQNNQHDHDILENDFQMQNYMNDDFYPSSDQFISTPFDPNNSEENSNTNHPNLFHNDPALEEEAYPSSDQFPSTHKTKNYQKINHEKNNENDHHETSADNNSISEHDALC